MRSRSLVPVFFSLLVLAPCRHANAQSGQRYEPAFGTFSHGLYSIGSLGADDAPDSAFVPGSLLGSRKGTKQYEADAVAKQYEQVSIPPSVKSSPDYRRPIDGTPPTDIAYRGAGPPPAGAGQPLVPGLTASIGFWHNKNGQALIHSFNGGPSSTALANWLAKSFPNLYGEQAGAHNLTGKTNTHVARLYLALFNTTGKKLEAQVLNTALDVYATTASLGGKWAGQYRFQVTSSGAGSYTYPIGRCGAAFGVPNGSSLTLFEILKAADDRAAKGVPYRNDAGLQGLANTVFGGLNEAGHF